LLPHHDARPSASASSDNQKQGIARVPAGVVSPLSTASPTPKLPRALHLALFAIGLLWTLAARIASENSAAGITRQFHLPALLFFLQSLFFAALLLIGFATLHWISTRSGTIRSINALPTRPTAVREFGAGATLGWGIALLAAFIMLLARSYHPLFWITPRSIGLTLLATAALAFSTLALELSFRGYLYQRLIDSVGVTAATLLTALFFAASIAFAPNSTPLAIATTFALGILLAIAYQRTHALWLSWGLHFAWAAVSTIVLGLPLAGNPGLSFLVSSEPANPAWLTGGFFGPQGSIATLLLALLAIPILYRLSRDFAWAYTHSEIVSAGHPMDIPPPAAHAAMESTITAAPAPLVQILGTTPTTASTLPVISEHLRSDSRDDS
jgi:membrane protease YdiL (CAAX protease family)